MTDLFCGAGGSSSGAVQVPGVQVLMAANHWPLAIESHNANHPETDHDCADLSQVDPRRYPRTDILWASPECTNHSIAKGVKRALADEATLFQFGEQGAADQATRSRATMWDVPRFAEHHRYKAIIIENVVDAFRWVLFPSWLHAMTALGYDHELVWLNSMHAQGAGLPAPQSRDRMYVVFTRKGVRRPDLAKWTRPRAFCPEHGLVRAVQSFKKTERWGRYRAQYVYVCPRVECRGRVLEPGWLPAASIIDWSVPGERIGDRAKPLAEKTRARIQRGIERYWRPIVLEAAGNTYDAHDPKHPQFGTGEGYSRAWPADEPLRTLHTATTKAVAVPSLVVNQVSGADASRSSTVHDPLPTFVAGGTHASLLIPVEGREGKEAQLATDAMRTQTTRNETALVVPMRNHGVAKGALETIDTVSAGGNHHALVVRGEGNVSGAKPDGQPIGAITAAGSQFLATDARTALLMRNNTPRGDAGQMSTPVDEPMRALTTAGHQSLIEAVPPVSLDVDDALFRMLTPDEIKQGMAFPADYLLLGTKRDQVKQAGNAVTPPAARDLIAAVAEALGEELEVAA